MTDKRIRTPREIEIDEAMPAIARNQAQDDVLHRRD
jgi:hypothetical protein